MKNTTIRVSEQTEKSAIEKYSAKVTGLQIACEGYFEIQKRTLFEIRGMFTKKELSAIADNLNGTILSPEFQANVEMFWHHLEDGKHYDGLFEKWNLEEDAFRLKVLALTSAQVFFLQDAVNRFWNYNQGETMEAFIAKML